MKPKSEKINGAMKSNGPKSIPNKIPAKRKRDGTRIKSKLIFYLPFPEPIY